MTEAHIHLRNVAVRLGSFSLDVPDWSLAPGRVLGVVGANGAGKTTLLRLLPGLDAPDRGTVRVFGLDPFDEGPKVRSQLGYMTDDMPIFGLPVWKLLRTVSGYYPTWDRALVDELVGRFNIDLKKSTAKLSKGEGTRLRLLLAMAFRPKVLVLDEPATGLDVAGRRALLRTVLDVMQEPERSVIISSHMLHDLERVADELLVIDEGKVRHHGETDTLIGEGRNLEEAVLEWGLA